MCVQKNVDRSGGSLGQFDRIAVHCQIIVLVKAGESESEEKTLEPRKNCHVISIDCFFFMFFFLASLIEYRIRLFYKRKKRKNERCGTHTQSNNPVATLRKHWTRPVLFSRGFGRFGDWLYNFTLFFGCAWSIMRSALFHSSLVLMPSEFYRENTPKKINPITNNSHKMKLPDRRRTDSLQSPIPHTKV